MAFPSVTKFDGGKDMVGWYSLFLVWLYISGVSAGMTYIEAIVCNILDFYGLNRAVPAERAQGHPNYMAWRFGVTSLVCVCGIACSALFTTNFGWIIWDITNHYVSGYILLLIGLLQCIGVGWLFEYQTTAWVSLEHQRSLKYLGYGFWVPVVTISFYYNALYDTSKSIGIVVMTVTTLMAWLASW